MSNFPAPKNIHEVRRFLGIASYFRKFIQGFANIAKPISSLTRKGLIFSWRDEHNAAFEILKTKLIKRPVLTTYDRNAETKVHYDASKGILLQKQNDSSLKPIQYVSRATGREGQNYHSYKLETFALMESLKSLKFT